LIKITKYDGEVINVFFTSVAKQES